MEIKCFALGEMGANCYFLTADGETAIIDPGAPDELLKNKIAEHADIRYILLTHRHADHLMGVALAKKLSGAKVAISREDADGLTDASVSLASILCDYKQTPVTPDILLSDGDILPLGSELIKVIATPGHTVGSVCFMIGDAIISGDTLFKQNCGRCDLPTGNYDDMLTSLGRLRKLDGDFDVYPGHGEATTLEFERKFNQYMREKI